MDDKTRQLLRAMREQIGDHSASRVVDAEAAANSLGMDSDSRDFDHHLRALVRAGYLEPAPSYTASTGQKMYRITFSGIYAASNHWQHPAGG